VVAEHLEGDVERPLLVSQHQIIERHFVARPAAIQQFPVARRRLSVRLCDTLHAEKFPSF